MNLYYEGIGYTSNGYIISFKAARQGTLYFQRKSLETEHGMFLTFRRSYATILNQFELFTKSTVIKIITMSLSVRVEDSNRV